MTKKTALLSYSAIILTIFALAYLGKIPTKLHSIPFYDSAGHFILYGLWGYFLGNYFNKPFISFRQYSIPAGIAAAVVIAVVEEFLQRLSPIRSFDYSDLAFGLTGIATACAILNYISITKAQN